MARRGTSHLSRKSATAALAQLERVLQRIDDPTARKIVIMSKWERGEITNDEAERLIRGGGLEAA